MEKDLSFEITIRKSYIDDYIDEDMQNIGEGVFDHKIWVSIYNVIV